MLFKLSNLNSNLALTLGYVNPALNNSAQCSTLFLYISLPLFYMTTMWNFQKLLSYTFFRENVVRALVHFFFQCHSFSLCIGSRYYFPFCHHRYKIFMLSFQQKNVPFIFLSVAVDLCRPFSGWASLACRLLSLFSCLSLALYSKLVCMTINLSLIL